ncbi:uncharacterized protein LOC127864897 [Dreissena polymorpha]|uniref:uncharacterized protein LOC127864897 n=1 Tax=Dreissena polymorpha TaxID=45954 RepID=UPI0022644F65|nr:uncharacterized protein LOC127864897 [Dreissena polymorpha]
MLEAMTMWNENAMLRGQVAELNSQLQIKQTVIGDHQETEPEFRKIIDKITAESLILEDRAPILQDRKHSVKDICEDMVMAIDQRIVHLNSERELYKQKRAKMRHVLDKFKEATEELDEIFKDSEQCFPILIKRYVAENYENIERHILGRFWQFTLVKQKLEDGSMIHFELIVTKLNKCVDKIWAISSAKVPLRFDTVLDDSLVDDVYCDRAHFNIPEDTSVCNAGFS